MAGGASAAGEEQLCLHASPLISTARLPATGVRHAAARRPRSKQCNASGLRLRLSCGASGTGRRRGGAGGWATLTPSPFVALISSATHSQRSLSLLLMYCARASPASAAITLVHDLVTLGDRSRCFMYVRQAAPAGRTSARLTVPAFMSLGLQAVCWGVAGDRSMQGKNRGSAGGSQVACWLTAQPAAGQLPALAALE